MKVRWDPVLTNYKVKPAMRKRRVYREHSEQAALIKWVRLNEHIEPRLKLLYAIPNGEHRTPRVAARLKAEGVRPGVPDICLPVACCPRDNRHWFGSLYVEMKSSDGRVSAAQREWRNASVQTGPYVTLCRTWIDAAQVICDYLGNPRLRPPE